MTASDATDAPDVMDRLAGLSPDMPLYKLRRQRPDVVRHLQGSDDALFAPKDDGGLTRAERVAVGMRIANLIGDTRLQQHYAERLAPFEAEIPGGASARDGAAARWSAIVDHVDRVTREPDRAGRDDIDRLRARGLSPHAIVSLSQLIAYVNFQARVLAGLRMLRDAK